jgi:hypothetical protein
MAIGWLLYQESENYKRELRERYGPLLKWLEERVAGGFEVSDTSEPNRVAKAAAISNARAAAWGALLELIKGGVLEE